jgi:hypothetical protein
MSLVSSEEFLTEVVTSFRKEFERFTPANQRLIKERAFDSLPFEPCQIEVLDFGVGKAVIWLLIHDNQLPDMMFKIHKDVKSVQESEFASKYKTEFSMLFEKTHEKTLFSETFHIFTKNMMTIERGYRTSQQITQSFLIDAKVALRTEQVDLIGRSTDGLKESIARILEKDIREQLLSDAKKIDKSLQEIKRIDEEIDKFRQLVGASQEYQDWRVLVSDVHKLKGEHVPREVFDTEIKRIDERINKGLEALNTRIEDFKAIKFWSKRTVLEITLAVWGAIVTLYAAGIIKF